MNTIRQWARQLIEAKISLRAAMLLAACSSALLLGLMVIWLGMSTRTALLDKQLEDLDGTQTALTDQINQTWTQIGEVTSPRVMEPRAWQLGFEPARRIEYLIVSPTITATVTVTPAVALTVTTIVTQ